MIDRQAIPLPVNPGSYRIYVAPELAQLDVECRGFLLLLEQTGILDSETRELVIDRVMALETDGIDLHQLKWIILMVLFNQPGQEEAYAWLEDLVLRRRPRLSSLSEADSCATTLRVAANSAALFPAGCVAGAPPLLSIPLKSS